ncbi:Suppressor of Profilin deletion [Malassezia sp. CBS 17886]|nr:Suppressor of Profilin deletion [Malassezia sp. CBS 17886]
MAEQPRNDASMYADAFVRRDPRTSLQMLQARMKSTRAFHEQIADYFAARREAEEAYVRSLQKLTKRSFLADATNLPVEFRPVYERLVSEIAEVAQAHTMMERRVLRDCEDPLRSSMSSGEWTRLKRHDEVLAPVVKDITGLETQLAKDQRRLEQKKTGAAQSRVAATQQSLSHAVDTWERRAPAAVSAYERVDYGRLRMLRDAVRQFARAESEMGKQLYDLARTTGVAAQRFEPQLELQRFATGARPAARSAAALPVSEGAPLYDTRASGVAPASEAAPGADTPSRTVPSAAPPHGDVPDAAASGAAGAAPGFAVPLPSAIARQAAEDPAAGARGTPPRGDAVDMPRRAAPNPGLRRATMHIAQTPVPENAKEDHEALERVQTQLRSSSIHRPARRRDLVSDMPWNAPSAAAGVATAAGLGIGATPIAAHVVERVNVMWAADAQARVMVVGEVLLRLEGAASTDGDVRPRLRLGDTDGVGRIAANAAVLQEVPGTPDEYTLDVAELARTPASRADGVVVLRYQVQSVDGDSTLAPLLLTPQWRCEPQQSSLLLTYHVNRDSRLVQRAPHAALEDVRFQVALPHATPVTGDVLSQPAGEWNPDLQQLQWTRPEPLPLASTESTRILARFPHASQGAPQPVSASWHLPACTLSAVSVAPADGGSAAALLFAPTTRETVAGKYFVQP